MPKSEAILSSTVGLQSYPQELTKDLLGIGAPMKRTIITTCDRPHTTYA